MRRSRQHPSGRRSQCTDLIQAMIFQTSSSVLRVSPKGGIGPTTCSEPLRTNPCFLKRVAWAETPGAKRDHPEQRVVVIAINPNLIGEGCRHTATTTASMAAIAVMRSIYPETFGGDTGEVRVGVFQLTSWRADRALQWRHSFLGGMAAPGQCGYDQTHNNSADCPRHGAFAWYLFAIPEHGDPAELL